MDHKRSTAYNKRRKKVVSVVSKFWSREIFGDWQRSRSSKFGYGGKRLFTTIPTRLAFPLKSVVDRPTLYDEGHVFLGFSSCDQFLLSYTEKAEVSSHTGFLSYVYTLHWWVFIVGSSAKKVGSVRLFGNEEIENSLFLCYVEWPDLKSQIVVYGWRKFSESCYITIAAVPSITNCGQCQIQKADNAADELDDCHDRCLQHGFAIHFKQASSTSQFSVLNSCGLKIDGMLVLNIGHSIAVISTGILGEGNDIEQLPLSSIKRADCEESVMDSELARVLRSDDQLEEIRREKAAKRVLQLDAGSNFHEMAWNISLQQNSEEVLSQKFEEDAYESCQKNDCFKLPNPSSKSSVYDLNDSDNTVCISLVKKHVEDGQRCVKSPLPPLIVHPSQCASDPSPYSNDPYVDPEPKSIILGQKADNEASPQFDEYDFDNYSDEKPQTMIKRPPFVTGCENGRCSRRKANFVSSSLPGVNHSLKHTSMPFSCPNCTRLHSKPCNCAKSSSCHILPSFSAMQSETDNNGDANESHRVLSDYGAMKRRRASASMQSLSSSSKVSSPLMVLSVLNKLQNLPDTRSELSVATPSPSASESSGSMYCSAESHLSWGVGKYASETKNSDGLVSFSENFYGTILQENITPDDPLPVGEGGVFFCSMHCQGAAGEMLHPLKKGQSVAQAFSQHLVLDLEHVIFDILRTRCYNAYKYGYLVDYEANITDVCKDTKSVVIHIAALLDMSQLWAGPTVEEKSIPTTQQAEFILCWRLHTGRYEVVIARPLQQYDAKKLGAWDGKSINKMDCEIRQLCSVSANPYHSIYLLDNAAVFRRQSLNVLWNCDKTIAITK